MTIESLLSTRQCNLAEIAVRNNNYLAYLPKGYTMQQDLADWKQQSDAVTSPRMVTTLYETLRQKGVIPAYSQSFHMVSYGSNIPTIERFLFDLDRKQRKGATQVTAVDLITIPPDSFVMTEQAGVCPKNDTFRFVTSAEEEFRPSQHMDLIVNFRASLYYYLRHARLGAEELLHYARDILKKYYRELKDTGAIVVDAQTYRGRNPATQMDTSTAEIIEDLWDDLRISGLFTYEFAGDGPTRVMILRKKAKRR